MVLEVLADAGGVDDDVDPHLAQVRPGPMPESINSCGLLIDPPLRTTSASARTTWSRPSLVYATPVARVPTMTIRVTNASVRTVRFGRRAAGWM